MKKTIGRKSRWTVPLFKGTVTKKLLEHSNIFFFIPILDKYINVCSMHIPVCVPDVPLDVYFFLNLHLHIDF